MQLKSMLEYIGESHMSKLTVGIYSLGGCEGCRHEIVNLGEELFKAMEEYGFKIVYEPLLGLRNEANYYDVVFIEGVVGSKEDVVRIRKIREKAKIVVALGSCSYLGGIPSAKRFIETKMDTTITEDIRPLQVPQPITKYIKVDYWLRGCPINKHEFLELLKILSSNLWYRQGERRFEYTREYIAYVKGKVLTLHGDKCIVCGRCIGICKEIGVSVLGTVFRGINVAVTTPFNEPFEKTNCIHCGLCTLYCPVGAITYREDLTKVQELLSKGKELKLFIEPEVIAALMSVLKVDDPGKIINALKILGFSRVILWSPMNNVRDLKELTIITPSEAEYLYIKYFHKDMLKHVVKPSGSFNNDEVVATPCVARKLEHDLVLTTRELYRLLVKIPVNYLNSTLPNEVRLKNIPGMVKAIGAYEVRGILDAIRRGYVKEGTITVYICPEGCIMGGGQLYTSVLKDVKDILTSKVATLMKL